MEKRGNDMSPYIQEIISGAGRAIDIGATFAPRAASRVVLDDGEAIAEDWKAVGRDICGAMARHSEDGDE
jgi:hypothetical protein